MAPAGVLIAGQQMLSALTGQEIYLKLENLQMTGAFKERGALNRISLLTPAQIYEGDSAVYEVRVTNAGAGAGRPPRTATPPGRSPPTTAGRAPAR